jgi:hypothetical protein
MGIDPVSAALGAAPFVREAIEKYQNRNEARRFFYHLRHDVSHDSALPHEHRKDVADRLFYLHADPNFIGPLTRYVEQDDVSAAAEIEPFVHRAVEGLAEWDDTETVAKLMRHVHSAANQAKRSDRDATFLQAERTIQEVRQTFASAAPVALLDVDWAPDWPQKALAKLGKEAPAEFAALRERIGTGDDPSVIEQLIRNPDQFTAQAGSQTWVVLARFAEHHGEWMLAREAWYQVAEKARTESDRVSALVHAAMNASVAGEDEMHDEDMANARAVDAEHPRVRLEDVSQKDSAEEQLRKLAGITTEDPDLRGLIESRRAAAYLLAADLERVRVHLEEAKRHSPEILQVRMVEANLVVHENRVAVTKGEPVDASALRCVEAELLDLRERLIAKKRWEEACRLLMLAVDAANVAGDHERAGELLSAVTNEELLFGEGDEVMADAAIRALHAERAPGLLHPDKPENDSRRRIRAHAAVMSREADHEEAVRELDDLASRPGPEQKMSQLMRVIAAALRGMPWSDEAETGLAEDDPHTAVSMKAFWLAKNGRFEEARRLLEPYRHEAWALEALFNAAWQVEDLEAASAVALEYLERFVPDQGLRFRFALVLAETGERARALPDLRLLASDERAPRNVRVLAYRLLAELIEDPVQHWEVIERWRALAPDDPYLARAIDSFADKLRAS